MASQNGIDAHQLVIDHINRHFTELGRQTGSPTAEMSWDKDWIVVTYDTAPDGAIFMGRSMILDLNDDGYFVTFYAKFSSWGSEDYELVALGYHGDEDEEMQVIPVVKATKEG